MVVASDFERAVLTRIVPVAIESIHRRVAARRERARRARCDAPLAIEVAKRAAM